jgi:GNAT superfamily N-acetyltransferase
MINFNFSFETEYDFIPDVLALDADVYDKELQGTYESVQGRYNMNKESYVLAYKNRKKLIGYICFFPITEIFREVLLKSEKPFDDDISPENIAPYSKNSEQDVFIISAVVDPEYQGNGIGKKMMDQLFYFLSKKIRSGHRIKNIYTYAYTAGGEALCESTGFKKIKRVGMAMFMHYQYDDFSATNMFLFVPFTINEKFDFSSERSDDFVDELRKISEIEFDTELSKNLKHHFIETKKFIILDDTGNNIIYNGKDVKIYMTYYKIFCVVILVFNKLEFEPTAILNQASMDKLLVANGDKNMLFKDYMRQQFNLIDTGPARCLTSLVKKPNEIHLAYMLACESYINSYVTSQLISPEFYKKTRLNIAQYDFSEIYVSEKSVVYVLNPELDLSERDTYEGLMIFVMELLILQICAISANYEEIIKSLDSMTFDESTIENVYSRFSQAALLWDINNFRFLPAKRLSSCVAIELGIPQLKEEYYANLGVFEKLLAMHSQKQIQKYSKNTQRYFTFFSLLSGITALGSIVTYIYDVTTYGFGESFVTLLLGGASTIVFIFSLLLSNINNKLRKKR